MRRCVRAKPLQPLDFRLFSEPRELPFGVFASVALRRRHGLLQRRSALFKKLSLDPYERYGFEFRVEFFNLFNRTQFAPPNTTCCTTNNANFGAVTATAPGTNPRLVQFAMKFLF